MITALAGGVGAARFLQGLVRLIDPEELTVIVNTGDDIELHGLHISPDLDIVIYTLAGIVDENKGWGIKGDTFNCLEMLGRYGRETWFQLGDRDLATHIHRTALLKAGLPLSKVTEKICTALGVKVRIIPMTDDCVTTYIVTDKGIMHLQEYLVKRRAQDEVRGVIYRGAEKASPAPGVLESIYEAKGIVICPSNPIVSIGPILAIKGVRDALRRTDAVKVGISPLIKGRPVKGPADKMMRGLGLEPSAYGVAKLYADFLDYFIVDSKDIDLVDRIRDLGIKVLTTDILMLSLEAKIRVAKLVLKVIEGK